MKPVLEKARRLFEETFHKAPEASAFAPGRVNLIGDHTDYQEGLVLPAAVSLGIAAAAAARSDEKIFLKTTTLSDALEVSWGNWTWEKIPSWGRYLLGVAFLLREQGAPVRGFEMLVFGDLPPGAGLSSSAALEVAAGKCLLRLFPSALKDWDFVHLCREAEHRFAGVPCGVMDQAVVAFNRKGHALFLDCRSLKTEDIPLPKTWKIVVFHSGVSHALAGGEYAKRRRECEEAFLLLKKKKPGALALRDFTVDEMKRFSPELPEKQARRLRHVVSENARVLEAACALREEKAEELQKLFWESHRSLREDYEVSCFELDVLVEEAVKHPRCFGARLTGGGFGGCTVNLVEENAVLNFIAAVSEGFSKRFNRRPQGWALETADGALNG